MSTPVDGLCHLLANQFDQWLEGDVVGLAHKSSKIWHYGFRLPDGRVLDKHGVHESEESWMEKANQTWPLPNFELVETEISEESVGIFPDEEHRKVKRFAHEIMTRPVVRETQK